MKICKLWRMAIKREESAEGKWDDVGMDCLGEKKAQDPSSTFLRVSHARMKLWTSRAITTLLLWTCIVQLVAIGEIWGPKLLKSWPSCSSPPNLYTSSTNVSSIKPKNHFPPKKFDDYLNCVSFLLPLCVGNSMEPCLSLHCGDLECRCQQAMYRSGTHTLVCCHIHTGLYANNGYLVVSCNGGLNQMRAAICDMVAIARYLNITLIVPELDKTSFWADSSDFQDIFDVDHFIASLRDEVRILKELPPRLKRRVELGMFYELPPVSWSNISYYRRQILPLLKKHKVVHLNKTDARLANNGLPQDIQKLRCKVNFSALRFTAQIEELGRKVVGMLRQKGPFLVLHLRYEMDMLSFSGCTQGCNTEEVNELTTMRYANPWWKEKVIDPDLKRKEGLCPLTPEETALVLTALGINHNVQIYIAAGEIYGGKRRLTSLAKAFPNLVKKETLLEHSDLSYFGNHSSQMAALDYIVSLESEVFVPTYDGNMAKVVEGHRRYLGFKKTIVLERRGLIGLIDEYNEGSLRWDEFSSSVKYGHANRMGSPKNRVMIPDKPKEEDYFYANPQECLV